MAKKIDKDDGDLDGGKPAGAPQPAKNQEPAREPLPDGFLPEDSFLLDLDDETAQAPAPTIEPNEPNEEWLLVDDDVSVPPMAPAAAQPEPAIDARAAESAPLEVTPEEAVAASAAGAAPATSVPAWYTEEEAELPKFVAEESDEAAAAPAGVGASAAAADADAQKPVADALAPVLPIQWARRKRMLVAAAGLLLAVGAGAFWFQMHRGADDGGAVELAARIPPAPRPTPPAPQPTPEPEPSAPDVAAPTPEPDPAPVAPEPTPVAAAPEIAPPAPKFEPKPDASSPTVLDGGRKRPLPPLTRDGNKGAPAKKDDVIVELKNGNTFRGQITRTKGSRVTLKVGAGECVFDLADVTLLDSSAPEYRRIDQMPEASVVLTSGAHLRGRLMKQNDEHVVLVVNNGQVVFDRGDVKNVSFTGRIHF